MLKHLRFKLFLIGCLLCANLMANSDYKVTASSLNVRASSSKNAKVIGSLKMNDVVSVIKIENEWAEIMYNNKQAYISAKYIVKVEVEVVNVTKDNGAELDEIKEISHKNQKSKVKKLTMKGILMSFDWNNWSVDFMPSMYVGVSEFIGDYTPKAHCGFGIGMGFQFYQKKNNSPQGWMSEASVGYALKGAGGMPIHYFSLIISPAGYIYTFKHDVILSTSLGLALDFGGGSLYAYSKGTGKYYYANPCDVGLQLKIATEWHKFGFAISYDQGFINAIKYSSLTLKNFGFNFHFYYRLWDIHHNNIYKP